MTPRLKSKIPESIGKSILLGTISNSATSAKSKSKRSTQELSAAEQLASPVAPTDTWCTWNGRIRGLHHSGVLIAIEHHVLTGFSAYSAPVFLISGLITVVLIDFLMRKS